MTWLKLDESFDDDCSVVSLSDAAFRTHVQGLCYTMRRLTDGWVDQVVIRKTMDTDDPQKAVNELCDHGWWRREGSGYRIIHQMEWQPTRAQVEAKRKADAERQQRARDKRADESLESASRPRKSGSRRDYTRDEADVTTGRVGSGRSGPGLEELPRQKPSELEDAPGPDPWAPPPGVVDLRTGVVHEGLTLEDLPLGACTWCAPDRQCVCPDGPVVSSYRPNDPT